VHVIVLEALPPGDEGRVAAGEHRVQGREVAAEPLPHPVRHVPDPSTELAHIDVPKSLSQDLDDAG
jgi:hypothetical protein